MHISECINPMYISNTAGEPSMHKILPPGQHQAHIGGSLNGSHDDHQHQCQHQHQHQQKHQHKLQAHIREFIRSQYIYKCPPSLRTKGANGC